MHHIRILISIIPLLFPSILRADEINKIPRGGELVIGILSSSPADLNPALHSGTYTGMPGAQLFAAPLRFDDQWNPQPYLAERWEVAADGLSVTLHLVKNARFHDGHPITSEDIAFSIATVKANHPFNTMFAPVTEVETPDPQTAVVRLSHPHPAILLAMSSVLLPVLPKHIFGDGQDIKTHPANLAPVGSGPFKFVEFVSGSHIQLVRNEDFFIPGRPYLDSIRYELFTIPDPLALSGGEIHALPYYTYSESFSVFADDPNIRVSKKGYEAIGAQHWLEFNLRKKPFNDIRVRQAIAYSVDRRFLVDTLLHGNAALATGPIVIDSPLYSADVEMYPLDVAKANALLDQAGYPRDNTGKRFTLRFDFPPANTEVYNALLDYLRDELLRKIGIDLDIHRHDNFHEWAQIVVSGEYSMTFNTLYNWGDPVIGVHRSYDCDNRNRGEIWTNTQDYCNPKVDALMAAAGQELDFTKRKALYAEFQKWVVADLPVHYLMKLPYLSFYNKNLEGLDDSIWGMMSPLDKVYWRQQP